ncbi:MAG: M48 family metallopeptidase [Proteobacteria bacterium]|nr:M48 family metallopeptidase [Pseudomonadota bacterium]
MNFFESQDKAKKKTFWLVLYFLLAIVFIILTIDLIFMTAIIALSPEKYMPQVNAQHPLTAEDILNIDKEAIISLAVGVALLISPVIIGVIFLGSLFKMVALKEGGVAVANMVNAREISPNTTNFLEKRFINIVEEMSIASGVHIPKLYVMEDEAINAFVAGFKPEDTVMVVTQGALDTLSRDELQSVVGHEFSHILNSDMHISLKLMGLLGGLLLIGQMGYFLLRFFGRSNTRSSSDNKSGGNIAIAILIVGLGLLIIGYVGLFFGRLIKAAVARQRELLADASSVQFTRNPQGLVYALRRILISEQGTYLATKNVEDISHLCFCTPRWIMFQNLLATHPPLEKRIALLDPEGQFKDLPKKITDKEEIKPTPKVASAFSPALMMGAASVMANVKIAPLDVKNSIGNPTSDHVQIASELISQIPMEIQDLAHNPQKVDLVFYALILSYHEDKIEEISSLLNKALSADDCAKVITLSKLILSLPKATHLPLLDISLPAFLQNSSEKQQQIYQNLQDISASADKRLFQFTLLKIIENATFGQSRLIKVKYTSFEPVIPDISQLLSVILKVGAKDQETEDNDFAKLMKNFTQNAVQRPIINNTQPLKFQDLLTNLAYLSPLCKEKLVHVLLECISSDNVLNLEEVELVRAIAASLNCPIPPIIARQ